MTCSIAPMISPGRSFRTAVACRAGTSCRRRRTPRRRSRRRDLRKNRSARDGQLVARLHAELVSRAGVELEHVAGRSGGRILRARIAAARRHALLDADEFILLIKV